MPRRIPVTELNAIRLEYEELYAIYTQIPWNKYDEDHSCKHGAEPAEVDVPTQQPSYYYFYML